jgi:hypothetical protein
MPMRVKVRPFEYDRDDPKGIQTLVAGLHAAGYKLEDCDLGGEGQPLRQIWPRAEAVIDEMTDDVHYRHTREVPRRR